VGLQIDQTSALTLLFLTFDLTPKGTGDVQGLTSRVFDYIRQLQDRSQEHAAAVYPSLQQMSKVTFDFQEAPDNMMDRVMGLSSSLLHHAPEDVLAGDTVIDELNPNLVSDLLRQMHPGNVNLALATDNFDVTRANMYEKWYQVPYSNRPVPQSMLRGWKTDAREHDEPRVPSALKFVPSSLAVLNTSAGEHPKQLNPKLGVELWWLGLGLFALPKVQLRVKLSVAGEMSGSSAFSALRQLHVELANQELQEPMEDYGVCGLNWEVTANTEGYSVSMDGYSEHMSALASQFAGAFLYLHRSQKQFQQARSKLLNAMQDVSSQMPVQHALESLSVVTTSSMFSRQETAESLKKIDHRAFEEYLSQLRISGLRVQMLATGNVDETGAKTLADMFLSKLGTRHLLTKAESASTRIINVSRAMQVRLHNPMVGDNNSATVDMYQFGVPDIAERVKVHMLGQMLANDVYDRLRTQQQLGYVVGSAVTQQRSILLLQVYVQGAKLAPDDVDPRIERVLDDFGTRLTKMDDDEFTSWKVSLRSTIGKSDQNMAQEADRFWAQIGSDDVCFERKNMALAFLETLTSSRDLVETYQVFRRGRKVSVRMFGAVTPMLNASTATASLPSLFVVSGDTTVDKERAAQGEKFWPDAPICRLRSETKTAPKAKG